MAGQIVITGASPGEPAGQRWFGPLTINGSTTIGESLYVALSSGDNTFTVPTGAVAALIVPPTGNTTVLKVRTNANSADAGLPLYAGALPFVYPFPATAPTSLIINAASSVALGLTIAFI